MPLWWIVTPLFLLVMMAGLAYLEDHVVGPVDRALQLNSLIESASPEEIERTVSTMLASYARRDHQRRLRLLRARRRAPKAPSR